MDGANPGFDVTLIRIKILEDISVKKIGPFNYRYINQNLSTDFKQIYLYRSAVGDTFCLEFYYKPFLLKI